MASEERVVSFLSQKEERRVEKGKVYNDQAKAKKRARKERYNARKAAEKLNADGPESAAKEALRTLGGIAKPGEAAVGAEELIPQEFRGEYDALVEQYGDEPTAKEATELRRQQKDSRKKRDRKETTEGKGKGKRKGDGDDDDDDDEEEEEKEKVEQPTGGDFAKALTDIVGGEGKRAKGGRLAGEDAATRRSKKERAERREAAEKTRLRRAIRNSACKKPDIANQGPERKLRILATKGVVQLFNAIAQAKAKKEAEETAEAKAQADAADGGQPAKGKGMTPVSQQAFLELLKRPTAAAGEAARPSVFGQGAPVAGKMGTADGAALMAVVAPKKEPKATGSGKWDALKDEFASNKPFEDENPDDDEY